MQFLLRKPDNYPFEVGTWGALGVTGRFMQLYFSNRPLGERPLITAAVLAGSLIAGHYLFAVQQTLYERLDRKRLAIAEQHVARRAASSGT